jgi:lipid II:glycine glycyltransferase (peptidoglycan interpeptide bridge formation enzyme)
MGQKNWRLGIYGDDKLIGLAQILRIKAKRGIFLFCPHGPIFGVNAWRDQDNKILVIKSLLEKLKELGKKEKADFIRIAPIWLKTPENTDIFKKLKFRNAPIHIHPEITWELDLNPKEEELMSNMRKTTRYLINKAKKDGVEIIQSKNEEDVEGFNEIYQKTVSRHGFVPFSKNYLNQEFQTFFKDNQTSLFFAKYKNELIASAIIIFWKGGAFYHQGASSQKYPKIPASYLLQWEAIREAKKRNCHVYNFWGIAPPGAKASHRFMGVTLFKMGFGGYMKELVRTQDYPLTKKYWLNFAIESIRSWQRHLI